MQCVGRLPLASQPGERWLYHMSAEILGVLIARVSGMPLSVFMRERIFEPLGMNDTGFMVPRQSWNGLRPVIRRTSSPAKSRSSKRRPMICSRDLAFSSRRRRRVRLHGR